MASSVYASTPETTNANRACRAVLGPCTDGLRDILRLYVPPHTFPHTIKLKKLDLPRLTADQRDLILPRHGSYTGNFRDMDISLLYILLRNISGISPLSKDWGNYPDPSDTSLSANIERIRWVRNRCVHSCNPSMSSTDFNTIWSTIRSTMADLDAFLVNGNKYEKEVDFLRYESMDPEHDLHYEEELRKQVEEDKKTREMVVNLESRIEETAEETRRLDGRIDETAEEARRLDGRIEETAEEARRLDGRLEDTSERVEKLDDKMEKLTKSPIPPNVREQCDSDVQKWREEDKFYYETHSFPLVMQKVRNQPCVTFVGVPGSGKSATAHHIALKLQGEGYEVVPVDEIREIKQYSDTKNPQVFVIDDVVGVFGLQKTKLDVLTDYEQKITSPCMYKSRTLMTCREAVFNETKFYKPFLTKEETVIKLHSSDNALDDNDKKQILKKYGLNVDLMSPALLKSTSLMFPLLCKLFSKETKFQALGSNFFLNPVQCIIDELDDMQRHNKMNYATLVLCMLNENSISKDILKDRKNEHFVSMKNDTLENCELESQTDAFKFVKALSAMEGTYTKQCGAQYTFIHDSMFEICAYQYGKQFPDQMLLYMSSSYIANYVKPQISEPGIVNKVKEKQSDSQSIEGDESNNDSEGEEEESDDKNSEREESFDLCIRLREDQYPLLAERLYRDIQNMELYDVFRNQVLKHPQVCQAFTGVLETKSYTELKSVFLSSQGKIDKIVSKRECIAEESEEKSDWSEWDRQSALVDQRCKRNHKGEFLIMFNVRVISWVIYYGHYHILQFIVQQTEQPNEVSELFWITGNSPHQSKSAIYMNTCNKPEIENNRLAEECRLLVLSCYSGDIQIFRVLLPFCKKAITGIGLYSEDIHWSHLPLSAACNGGHIAIVKELVKLGADVNLQDGHLNTPLIAACEGGHISIVKELVKLGTDVNPQNRVDTPLIAACRGGHITIVKELVKLGADVNPQNRLGDTPLIDACQGGHISIVKELVKLGTDVNPQNRVDTPLIAACRGGHITIVKELVKLGADVNLQNGWENTPLMAACKGGDISIVKELVKAGADVNLQNILGDTPLIRACEEGHISIVKELVKLGADVNPQNRLGDTPLIDACQGGHISIVKELVKLGTDVNPQNRVDTPLIAACRGGHITIVKELVKLGADVNLQNGWENTPLMAACKGGDISIVKELVKAGADVNLQNILGDTPLITACQGGHISIVTELVKLGADVNPQNRVDTPLITACRRGHITIVKELVKLGADVNPQNRLGDTPLIDACQGGHISIVKELVKAGADVNPQNRGNTPLIAACQRGHISIVKELVKLGADVNVQNRLGDTPLIAAVRQISLSVVKYLVEHGADWVTQVVDIDVSAVYKALILNKPDIVKYLIREQNKILPGQFNGNMHLFNCLVDIRHAGVKTDSRDDVMVTNRSVWCMDEEGDLWKTIKWGDCDVLRHLLCVGLDVNQSMQLYNINSKSDVRPLLYTLIGYEWYAVKYRTEKVGILLGAGADVNVRVRYKECDSVLDREGMSFLERTRRQMFEHSHIEYLKQDYKSVMCEKKEHVRRHSV
ncbi:uncharacterized protein LOC125661395 isoform X2 [Ostrea edulis]|uniref:uncharacterized protein LOC125661395 isoform X2 n=1 Tax=Ostrea edulis TaxID=37623 RepID=UPI0024AFC7AC|nr:uncharacterized protein LOC125661395 isoform X2 [Ostrea edulis]